MEGPGGASISDMLVRDGRRQSLYRAYVHPWLDRPNLMNIMGKLMAIEAELKTLGANIHNLRCIIETEISTQREVHLQSGRQDAE